MSSSPEVPASSQKPASPPSRDQLIRAATGHLSGVMNAQPLDPSTAAAELARAHAALRLAQLHDTSVAERLRRWLGRFAVVAAAILLLLASCEVRRIEVEGAVRSESVSFRASKLVEVDLEAFTPEFSAVLGDGVGSIDAIVQDTGRIIVNQISVPRGSVVQLSTAPGGIVGLYIRCDSACDVGKLNLTLRGEVVSRRTLVPYASGLVELPLARGDNHMEFRLAEAATVSGTSQIEADSLSFHRDEVRAAGERERAASTSTVVDGELRNVTMNGERQPLGRGDGLTIASGPFNLRSVRVERGTFVTEFTGRPRELRRGGRSLVPSRLEWLWTRRPLAVLWTAFASLLITLAGAVRWHTSTT